MDDKVLKSHCDDSGKYCSELIQDKSMDSLDLSSLIFFTFQQVRMARPEHQKDGVVTGRGGETVAPGQANANPVENHCPNYWENCCTVFGTL